MKKLLLFLFLILPLFILSGCEDNDYDYIEYYEITVNKNDDGTLNMSYKINWNVLQSGDEDFILIGVPNKHVYNISEDSDDIRNISYYDDDGSYVRLNLNGKFKKGQKLLLTFSFTVSHMFTITKDDTSEWVNYVFIPGWFEEIKVGTIKVMWDSEGVAGTDSKAKLIDGYYVWTSSLDHGETIKCKLHYDINQMPNINRSKHAYDDSVNEIIPIIIIISVVLIAVVIIIIYANFCHPNYYSYRGFYPRYRYRYRFWHYHGAGYGRGGTRLHNPNIKSGSGGFRGGGCACACACAGGGRAGCSRKDFYYTSIKTEDLYNYKEEK